MSNQGTSKVLPGKFKPTVVILSAPSAALILIKSKLRVSAI
jgi:hypothetical protein